MSIEDCKAGDIVNIVGTEYNLLMSFECYTPGWEMDNIGWYARNNSTYKGVILMSSHGIWYECENLDEFTDELVKYQKNVDVMNKILTLLWKANNL
jgi:hypothetical protein